MTEVIQIDDDITEIKTIVLIGKSGNGKSSTGNSILRSKTFKSKPTVCVTSSTELGTTVKLPNGCLLNVIDTPGLFDLQLESKTTLKEIVRCMELAKNEIHAFILVLTVRSRFSKEEADSFEILKAVFGEKIVDHLIIVFTGGDELSENNQSLEDYLGQGCPQPLQEILKSCRNRMVVFDNKTNSEIKQEEQLQKLLAFLDDVIKFNGGKAYCSVVSALAEQKVKKKMNSEQSAESFRKKLAQERNLRINSEKSGTVLLAEIREARKVAEIKAKVAEEIYENEIRKLYSRVSIASRQDANKISLCIIM